MGMGCPPEILGRALLEPQYGGEGGGRQVDARHVAPCYIAPGAVLPRHAYHQGLQLCSDLRASKRCALLGTVTLLGYQLAVPREDRVGGDDAGDLR